MTWKEPKTDWVVNPKNPMAEDFNRIEGNIQALKDDIEIKKGDIVNALRSIGMDVSITDTYEDIANKIKAADQGAKIITPGTSNITIPEGFHNGSGYVKGDSNLRSSNILSGKSIFGVSGNAPLVAVGTSVIQKEQVWIGGKPRDKYSIYVSNLGFTPNIVAVWHTLASDFVNFGVTGHSEGGIAVEYTTGWSYSNTNVPRISGNSFEVIFETDSAQSGTAYWMAVRK